MYNIIKHNNNKPKNKKMKTTTENANRNRIKNSFRKKKYLFAGVLLAMSTFSKAQDQNASIINKQSMVVLNIDTKIANTSPENLGNIVRMELEALNLYSVMDRYDVAYLVEKNKLNISECYGKTCLTEIGNILHADKMLTGSAEILGETIVMTFRLIDVKTGTIEKTQVNDFLLLPKEIQAMTKISIRQLFGLSVDQTLLTYLTKKNGFESSTNNQDRTRVNLSGPRTGFTYYTGEVGRILQKPKSEGGFGSYPVMFQFGYQFEKQYLNEGNYQALFEFIPTISGFNQNVFIPSITLLNGFRDNKNGWEIAFGPTFALVCKANGYYDASNVWHLETEYTDVTQKNPYKIEKRLDSRGIYELQAGFIVAVGKTFKSGKLNIPVNAYVSPSREGIRCGVSFGFNAKR